MGGREQVRGGELGFLLCKEGFYIISKGHPF